MNTLSISIDQVWVVTSRDGMVFSCRGTWTDVPERFHCFVSRRESRTCRDQTPGAKGVQRRTFISIEE